MRLESTVKAARKTGICSTHYSPRCFASCVMPAPAKLSLAAFQRTTAQMFDGVPSADRIQLPSKSPRKPRITILKRIDGSGLRSWLNEADILRVVAEETGVSTFTWATPFALTPAHEQVEIFLSERMNVHHQIIRSNAEGEEHRGEDSAGWRQWDLYIDLPGLRLALRNAMAVFRNATLGANLNERS
eukprot:SAG22_NODE_2238_length_2804_cov_2.080591_4_plen_187_part_00